MLETWLMDVSDAEALGPAGLLVIFEKSGITWSARRPQFRNDDHRNDDHGDKFDGI